MLPVVAGSFKFVCRMFFSIHSECTKKLFCKKRLQPWRRGRPVLLFSWCPPSHLPPDSMVRRRIYLGMSATSRAAHRMPCSWGCWRDTLRLQRMTAKTCKILLKAQRLATVCLSDFSCFSFCPCFDTDSAWRFLDILSGRGPTSEGVCKQEVAWARETGIQQHPEWYPGLSAQSRFMACRGCFADRGVM